MLDIVLNILAVLGIIILVLLGVLVVLLLLVLFFPVSYRVFGSKSVDAINASIKLFWLFGLLRGRFEYPEPEKVIVKFLWFKIYDSASQKKKTESYNADREGDAENDAKNDAKNDIVTNAEYNDEYSAEYNTESKGPDATEVSAEGDRNEDENRGSEDSKPSKGIKAFIYEKYEKIKYTILKIYDKIKHILDNISYYKELLQDEQTKALLHHIGKRLKKIWKNIHPRTLRANVVFGTGSPDTTGYAMGLYGILSPLLGKDVIVTPDFSESVIKGEVYLAGHITVFQVIFHSLMVLLDKRLRLFIKRLKKGKGK